MTHVVVEPRPLQPAADPSPVDLDPPPGRRRAFVALVTVLVLAGIVLGGLGATRLSRASQLREEVATVEKQIGGAEAATRDAEAGTHSAAERAARLDTQSKEVGQRLATLLGTVDEAVAVSNRLLDECLHRWTDNQITDRQVLECLPTHIDRYAAALAAQRKAIDDGKASLAVLEGGLDG